MSNLELIERLCCLLDSAQEIIRQQAEILAMHGIETDTGELEQRRSTLLFQDATQLQVIKLSFGKHLFVFIGCYFNHIYLIQTTFPRFGGLF